MAEGARAGALLDACVLYPTVMREMLLGCAARGLFRPLWSRRIEAEWLHTAARRDTGRDTGRNTGRDTGRDAGRNTARNTGRNTGHDAGAHGAILARGEVARLHAAWPGARVEARAGLEAQLWLPDPADRHVLAAAISARARWIVTQNLRDFPRRVLGEFALEAVHPDAFLFGLWRQQPGVVRQVATAVHDEAVRLSGQGWSVRRLMKKARLPRLGKALEQAAASPRAAPALARGRRR